MSHLTNEPFPGADWNVLTSPWLDTMRANAEAKVCSPLDALNQAKGIRCIAAASPFDRFAAHRFLLTLLYWKADAAGGVQHVRESLLRGEVPQTVLGAIKAEAHRFRMFDDEAPFLQEAAQKNAKKKDWKSVGSLFAEFPSGINIAHFHHGDDRNMRLCLRCATMGMLRVVPWSQSGGQGKTPSVHNAPPIMAMALGANLAVTLGLNLVPLAEESGEAKWSGHFEPTAKDAEIPYLEAFTWNPRRIHLLSPQPAGKCWGCGQVGVTVIGRIVYLKNEQTKKRVDGQPFEWQDPAAFYSYDKPYIAIKSTDRIDGFAAVNCRDLRRLLDEEALAKSEIVAKNPDHRGWCLVIPCTTGKDAKTFDHRQIAVESLSSDTLRALVPPAPLPWRQQEVDGWTSRRTARLANGTTAFVQFAIRLLTHADWAVLACAAYRPTHESPAAFDLLTGLLWGLRDRRISGLPSRNVAWLVLKLMAGVPSHARFLRPNARFCPLDVLPKRQLDERRGERGVRSPYPISLPRGQRLEAALHSAIHQHLRLREPTPIDWQSLCHRLNQLLGR
ncbi:MAG: type I-E CRISPR-associated protein Cse1/CasA [Sedimentisphaerales bacterium]|nr:type I-E CRISPR-associated protein Cse1/CasA [Sedimentisphaerales bacterium]